MNKLKTAAAGFVVGMIGQKAVNRVAPRLENTYPSAQRMVGLAVVVILIELVEVASERAFAAKTK